MNRPLTGALTALAIAIGGTAALPTQAQDNPNTAQMNQPADDDRDFGWIGLLGLIGLAGLMGRKRDNHYDTAHRTTAAR
jgi:LPXTG-motif cell wall-anchored protein